MVLAYAVEKRECGAHPIPRISLFANKKGFAASTSSAWERSCCGAPPWFYLRSGSDFGAGKGSNLVVDAYGRRIHVLLLYLGYQEPHKESLCPERPAGMAGRGHVSRYLQ